MNSFPEPSLKPLSEFHFVEGEVLLFDKPLKWTSFDVVNKVRWLISNHLKKQGTLPKGGKRGRSKIKVGHAGTLDPLASGLLILCTGQMTKSILHFQDEEKEYTGTIGLDGNTPSYDLETEVSENFETSHLTEELIKNTAKKFIGKQKQFPPAFSAKSIDGVRAYTLARKGVQTDLKASDIEITDFEITSVDLENKKTIGFRVVCSKGTYIRSLAFDLGKELRCGGYLTSLCRTRIGANKLENAWNLQNFIELMGQESS